MLGVLLRIVFYSYNRPLWNDECALALNIIDSSVFSCFKTLSFSQAAPPIFLLISKMFYTLIPLPEFALRFFPLVCSILSIFVFYDFSKQILNKKSTIFFALILFCFNYQLIYFAQEFKQYSTDVLIFLLILTSYFRLKITESSVKKLVAIGVFYAACVWLSFTSVFAIAALFCVLTIKNIKEYKKITLLALPILFSITLLYINQHSLSSNDFLHQYWAEGFIKTNFSNLFLIITNYFIFAFNNLFLFLLFFVGLILKIKNIKSEKSLLLLAPILLAIFMSYFSIYPLSSRVSLYLIPIFILFIVQVIDYINFKNKMANSILIYFIIIFASAFVIANSLFKINLDHFEYEDILTPLNIASQEMSAGDILYLSDGSLISYDYYKRRFKFKNVMREEKRIMDMNLYSKELNNLPKGKTYYYVYSHSPEKQKRLNDVYLWAKGKKNFRVYADKSSNALIIFSQ